MLPETRENLRYLIHCEIDKQLEKTNEDNNCSLKEWQIAHDITDEILDRLKDTTIVVIDAVNVFYISTSNKVYADIAYYSDCRIGLAKMRVYVDI